MVILAIVDRFSRMTHFAPLLSAKETAQLIIQHVFWYLTEADSFRWGSGNEYLPCMMVVEVLANHNLVLDKEKCSLPVTEFVGVPPDHGWPGPLHSNVDGNIRLPEAYCILPAFPFPLFQNHLIVTCLQTECTLNLDHNMLHRMTQ